jgi:hypothetical protein
MTDRTDQDARLRSLLDDAVSDVDPADRLEQLRASVRPRPRVVPMTPTTRQRSWYSLTGMVATASVIGIVALVTNVVADRSPDLGPATDSGTSPPSTTATAVDTNAPKPRAPGHAPTPVTVYYLGDSPVGTVLYREQRTPTAGTTPLAEAVRGLMAAPNDPDYRTVWRAGWLVRASRGRGSITVQVGSAPTQRPAGMTPRDATEAVQQVVYTVQSALGLRDKVQFVRRSRPVRALLGVPTSRPVGPAPPARTLARLSISTPDDGTRTRPGRLVVTGVDDVYGPGVTVSLVRSGTTYLRKAGTATDAYEPDRMFPWQVVLDTTALAPGRYTVVASAGHGGAERDTRVVHVR